MRDHGGQCGVPVAVFHWDTDADCWREGLKGAGVWNGSRMQGGKDGCPESELKTLGNCRAWPGQKWSFKAPPEKYEVGLLGLEKVVVSSEESISKLSHVPEKTRRIGVFHPIPRGRTQIRTQAAPFPGRALLPALSHNTFPLTTPWSCHEEKQELILSWVLVLGIRTPIKGVGGPKGGYQLTAFLLLVPVDRTWFPKA